MDIKTAIQCGDATGLRELLAADPARANHLVGWGAQVEIHTHPLLYVSDMLLAGTLEPGTEMLLIESGGFASH